jgi:hypothetical protein
MNVKKSKREILKKFEISTNQLNLIRGGKKVVKFKKGKGLGDA